MKIFYYTATVTAALILIALALLHTSTANPVTLTHSDPHITGSNPEEASTTPEERTPTIQSNSPYHPAMPIQSIAPLPDMKQEVYVPPPKEYKATYEDLPTLNDCIKQVIKTNTTSSALQQAVTAITSTPLQNPYIMPTGQLPPVFNNTGQNQISPQ